MAYDSTLFVHVPIYLKLKEQPILDLFRTESYAIPYDPADLVSNEYGEWIGSYTKIEFEKKYMAIEEEIYLSFNQEDLDNCKRIGGLFYCENMLLLKHISEHTCASAIYMNKMESVKSVCSVKYLEGYRPKPQIVETSNYILLIGMPTPWNLYCNRALDILILIKENLLAMIRWKDLCYCGFSAGTFYINENIISCENEKRRLSSKISTYYTINTITADYFHETMFEINKTDNKLMLEIGKQINIIDMTYANLNKRKQKYVELSGNIITDEQIDLTSPEWKFLDNDRFSKFTKRSGCNDKRPWTISTES